MERITRTAPGSARPFGAVAAAVAGAVLVGLATAAIAWWRLGPVARGTVWAEDGGVFLRDRIALGPVDSLLHPYAGYLHLVPRLLVDVGWSLPVADYALVLSAGACVVVGVLAGVVFVCARDVVPAWPLRALLALLPALLPLAPYEISGNAANLHWFALAAAPWLFAYRARSWWGAGAVAGVTVFVVLSEFLTVLFLPLLLLAWFPVRGDGATVARSRAWPRAVPVTVVALAGTTAQVVTALTDRRTSAPGEPAVADVVAGWLLQPLAGLWNPDVGAAVRAVVAHGWAAVLVPAVLLVAVLVAAVVVGPWRVRWVVVALAAASAGVWWVALLANGGAVQPWAHPVAALAAVPPQRYAAASGLLFVSAVVVAASVLVGLRPRIGAGPGGAPRLVGALAGWCVVALVVVATVGNVAPGPTRRGDGPVWAPQVAAAVTACAGDPSRTVGIRTAPWTARVPCGRLLER